MIYRPSVSILLEADDVNIEWKSTTGPTEPFGLSWEATTAILILFWSTVLPGLWKKLGAEKPSWNTGPSLSALSLINSLHHFLCCNWLPSHLHLLFQSLLWYSNTRWETCGRHYRGSPLPKHKSPALHCKRQGHVNGWANEIWAVMSGSLQCNPSPSCSNQMTKPQDLSCVDHWVAAGRTADLEHLPDSQRTQSKKHTFVVVASVICSNHTKAQPHLTDGISLVDIPRVQKNPPKIKLSTYFHLNPEEPIYSG